MRDRFHEVNARHYKVEAPRPQKGEHPEAAWRSTPLYAHAVMANAKRWMSPSWSVSLTLPQVKAHARVDAALHAIAYPISSPRRTHRCSDSGSSAPLLSMPNLMREIGSHIPSVHREHSHDMRHKLPI